MIANVVEFIRLPAAIPAPTYLGRNLLAATLVAVAAAIAPLKAEPPSSIISSGIINSPLSLEYSDEVFLDFDYDAQTDIVIASSRWSSDEEDEDQEIETSIEIYPLFGDPSKFRFAYQLEPWIDEWAVGKLPQGAKIGPETALDDDGSGLIYRAYEDEYGVSFETEWTRGSSGFLGFSFVPSASGLTHYGWVEIEIAPSGESALIRQWAWNSTPETAILAGDSGEGVPPPPDFPLAQIGLQMEIFRIERATGDEWIVFPRLTTTDPTETGQISLQSPGGHFKGYLAHPEGTIASSFNLRSFAALSDALHGTWTLTATVGSASTSLSFPVDVSGISESSFPSFVVNAPAYDAEVEAATFSANWSPPQVGSWDSLRLLISTVDRSGSFPSYSTDVNTLLDPAATTFSQALTVSEKRMLLTYTDHSSGLPGLVVGSPVDQFEEPTDLDWQFDPVILTTRSEIFFHAVDSTSSPDTGFAGWAGGHFSPEQLDDPAVSGAFATPANDGVTNLEKYALGMASPFAFEPAKLPRLDPGFVFDIINDDVDLTWRIEVSHDLQTWRHNGDGAGGPYLAIDTADNGDGTSRVTAGVIPPAGDGPVFLRLRLFYP